MHRSWCVQCSINKYAPDSVLMASPILLKYTKDTLRKKSIWPGRYKCTDRAESLVLNNLKVAYTRESKHRLVYNTIQSVLYLRLWWQIEVMVVELPSFLLTALWLTLYVNDIPTTVLSNKDYCIALKKWLQKRNVLRMVSNNGVW